MSKNVRPPVVLGEDEKYIALQSQREIARIQERTVRIIQKMLGLEDVPLENLVITNNPEIGNQLIMFDSRDWVMSEGSPKLKDEVGLESEGQLPAPIAVEPPDDPPHAPE